MSGSLREGVGMTSPSGNTDCLYFSEILQAAEKKGRCLAVESVKAMTEGNGNEVFV